MKNQCTFHLRIPETTLKELDEAAQKTGLTRQNVCRVAISLGLSLLAKEGYHLAPALKAQAEMDGAAEGDADEKDGKVEGAALAASGVGGAEGKKVPGLDFPADG